MQTQVNAQRADAEQLVQRARDTDHPDELDSAHGWLVEALQFRADAIEKVAAALPEALGDQRGSSDAINAIAGQMQALLASDVIYLQRTVPGLLSAYKEQGIEETLPDGPVPAGPRLARPRHGADETWPHLRRGQQHGDAGPPRHRHPDRHRRARGRRAHRERCEPGARERTADASTSPSRTRANRRKPTWACRSPSPTATGSPSTRRSRGSRPVSRRR